MNHPNFIILYVDQPEASRDFYAGLLGMEPVEASPTFALFALKSGVMLGLWSKHTVEPASAVEPGASEIAVTLDNYGAVDNAHANLAGRGISILMPPKTLEFGRSFVATDPDGHRIRIFAPAMDDV